MKSIVFKSVLLSLLPAGPAFLFAQEEPYDDNMQTAMQMKEEHT